MEYSIPSLVHFEQLPDPMKKTFFLKFVICEIRKFPYEELTFFPRQAIPKFFSVLDSSYPWNTRYQVWFILNNSLTRWKRPSFKYTYSKLFGNKRKIPYEKVTFFLGKLYQKFLLFYTLSRPKILHTGFGWIWITPWPDENDLFLKIVIREIRKFPYEIITFFLGKLYQKFFLF